MCACVYMYVCVCMYFVSFQVCVCVYVCLRMHTHMYLHIVHCTHTCIHTNMYICMLNNELLHKCSCDLLNSEFDLWL
jgi:hypothetical protein